MNQLCSRRLALALSLALAAPLTQAADAAASAAPASAAHMFARHAEYSDASISPTGEYVSVTTPFEDRRALTIIKLSGNYESKVIKFGTQEIVANATWVDDKRLIVEKAKDLGYRDQPVLTGQWFAADADAGNQLQLFGYIPDDGTTRGKLKDEGYAYLLGEVEGSGGDALFGYQAPTAGNSSAITKLYRVNSRTGQRHQLESYGDGVSFITDRTGKARVMVSEDMAGNQFIRYRRLPTDTEWTQVPSTVAGQRVAIWKFDTDNDHVFARISDKGEPAALYRVSLSEGTRERIAGHPDMDVQYLYRSGRNGGPYAVMYDAGKPKIDFVDPKSEWAQLHSALLKLFPGQLVSLENFTKDDNVVLFRVFSDRHPSAYYTFDRRTKKPTLLFESMAWIDPARMAPMAPMEFTSRDGQKLFGFYTAPLNRKGPHPLIVMPHGGPFEISDAWGYDADVQYLASLGYAVLQVNFRGSGSRGDAFERSGWKGWGTTIQDDITDGVRALIGQNLVDKDKVCIYGVSFGGYSALMNPIRNPGMYKCAIGYAGVYDLELMEEAADHSKQLRAFWARTMGTTPEILQEQSPARHVAKLDVPVLLIHGKADTIARYDQFTRLKGALEGAGKPFETLVKPEEGHGFYKVEHQAEAYEKMAAFLRKYNPVN